MSNEDRIKHGTCNISCCVFLSGHGPFSYVFKKFITKALNLEPGKCAFKDFKRHSIYIDFLYVVNDFMNTSFSTVIMLTDIQIKWTFLILIPHLKK